MTYDKSINPDENIVNIFEPGVHLIGKCANRSIINGSVGLFLGFVGFAYGANMMASNSFGICIMIPSAMLAVANANIISKNIYARRTFGKGFEYMTLAEKIQYIGEYIPYLHKLKYADLLESIICSWLFITLLVFYANTAINDLSTKNVILVGLYFTVTLIASSMVWLDKTSFDLARSINFHWKEYLKYK